MLVLKKDVSLEIGDIFSSKHNSLDFYLWPFQEDEEDDSFEGEELSGLQELVTAMDVSCTAEEFFLAAKDEIQICSGFFHPADSKFIKSENEALRLSEMQLEYSRYHGQEDLTLAISKATNLLQKMKF